MDGIYCIAVEFRKILVSKLNGWERWVLIWSIQAFTHSKDEIRIYCIEEVCNYVCMKGKKKLQRLASSWGTPFFGRERDEWSPPDQNSEDWYVWGTIFLPSFFFFFSQSSLQYTSDRIKLINHNIWLINLFGLSDDVI